MGFYRDSMGTTRVAGKTNIIAPKAVMNGDLRFATHLATFRS